MLRRDGLHLVLSMLIALLAPCGLAAAAQAPVLSPSEDVGVAASAAMPMAAERDEQADLGGVQGERFVFFGMSIHEVMGLDRLSLAGAVDAGGQLLWTWTDDQPFTTALDLFVPRDGDAAFALLEREQKALELRRFEADGSIGWQIAVETISDSPDLALLAGARDGSRLFLQTTPVQGAAGVDRMFSIDPATGGVVWLQSLPSGTGPRAVATDAAGARVFALVEADQPEISPDRVLALDGATGAILWTGNVSNTLGYDATEVSLLGCEPDGSLVYVSSRKDPPGGDPTLLALHGTTGAELWSADVPGIADAIVVDEVGPYVYVVSRDPFVLPFGPVSVHVTRLRGQVGDVLWTRELPVAMLGSTPPRLVHDSVLDRLALSYTGSDDTDLLLALDVEDGGTLWQVQSPHDGDVGGAGGLGAMAVAGTSRYVQARRHDPDASDHADLSVAVFASADGSPLGASTFAVDSVAPRALGLAADSATSVLYALARDSAGVRSAAAFDRAGLMQRWQVELAPDGYDFGKPGPGERIASSPSGARAFAARVASFGDPAGVECLDGATGALLWSRSFAGYGNAVELHASPAGDALYVVHDAEADSVGWPGMRAIDAASGADLWAFHWPPSFPGSGMRAPAGAVSQDGEKIAALVSKVLSPATLVVRAAADGALLLAADLDASDFGIPINTPLALDVVFAPGGASAFALASFLGGTSYPPSYGLARVELASGAVAWGVEFGQGVTGLAVTDAELLAPPGGDTVIAVVRLTSSAPKDERTLALAFDAASGAVLWQAEIGALGAGRAFDEAALDAGGEVLVVSVRNVATGAAFVHAFEAPTGTELWQVELEAGTGADRIGALLARDGAVFTLSGSDKVLSAVALTELGPEALVSGPDAVSLAAPASAVFLLDRPASSAGAPYLVLGSASGTSPGIPLGPSVLPLVLDPYLLASVNHAGDVPFVDTLGLLDAGGDGRAELALPPGLSGLAGLVLHHAFLELKGGVLASFASEPVTLQLVP